MATENLCYGWLPVDFYMLDIIYENNTTYYYGAFNTFTNGETDYPYSGLIKLNEDLSVDTDFNIGTGFNQVLYTGESITKQDDGKIICTGFFTLFDGVSQNRVTRLNADGSIDLAFSQNIGTGFNNFTQGSKVDSNGSIVITGLFDNFNGTPSSRIARLLSDGTIDPSFAIGSGFSGGSNTGTDVLINPDNSMFCLGYWNTFNGTPVSPGITKLTSTGSLDPSFNGGTGFNPYLAVNPNYFIRYSNETSFYVTGYFTSYNGVSANYIIKLNEDGSIDTSANFGTGFNNSTYLSTILWDDKIYIQGDFTSYNGVDSYQNIILNLDGSVFYSFAEPVSTAPYDYFQPLIVGDKIYIAKNGCYEEQFDRIGGVQINETSIYTLTYDDGVKGFPSFYTFFPDWMIGMNNYFYTFKEGNLYRHNTNERRNNYYGIDYASIMTSVFNEEPLSNKIFKTLALESDDSWTANVFTDEQSGNFIQSNEFELKEGEYFGYLRASNSEPASVAQYPLRSANGIGNNVFANLSDPSQVIINFSVDPLVSIGTIISVGDLVYTKVGGLVTLIGRVVNKVEDIVNGENFLIVDTTITDSSGNPLGNLPPTTPVYYFFIKNGTAESHGILGHYAVFTLTNNNTGAVELFAVESDVMKSFP